MTSQTEAASAITADTRATRIALAESLVGKLIKRGRKLYWVGFAYGTGQVHVYSVRGSVKSFPMCAFEAHGYVVRDACASDMDPRHTMSAHMQRARFAMAGQRDALATASAICGR